MLKVEKLRIAYGDIDIIKSVNFELNKGDRLVIVGESGCGKTTLLKTIAGYLEPKSGRIFFYNQKVKGPKEQLVPGHEHIKLVNQDFSLDEFHTVKENIKLRLLQYNSEYISYRIEELLKVIGLEKHQTKLAHQLSGGQKQRLAIARALADEPDLLLLDEPFNQLDYFLKQKIENYIDVYLKKHKISVILVSHNGEETMRWADEVMFLKSGKITRIDSPKNFYNHPTNKKEAGFFGIFNTVYLNGRYIHFRPHSFALKKSKNCSIKIEVIFIKSVYMGWYYDNQYKVGNRIIHLHHSSPVEKLSTLFIEPIFDKEN